MDGRSPDCLCELLVDLVVVPLAQLDQDSFQRWTHTTSICVGLLTTEALRHFWIQRVASRMLMEFPQYPGGAPQCVADFTCRLLQAPWEWQAWKQQYAPAPRSLEGHP